MLNIISSAIGSLTNPEKLKNTFRSVKNSKVLKCVEDAMVRGFQIEKIDAERNDRNKSSYVWPSYEDKYTCRVKLEIGSNIRPDPYSIRVLKTYIQEYLEAQGMFDVVEKFGLDAARINTLDTTRTFLDKVMAVKRHSVCGNLLRKVRHIYDVTVLFQRTDIQEFLNSTEHLKELLKLTKETDSFYLKKRNISNEYNPAGPYSFESWQIYFNDEIKERYESLHEDLLYSSEKQNFDDAIRTFAKINRLFGEIGE